MQGPFRHSDSSDPRAQGALQRHLRQRPARPIAAALNLGAEHTELIDRSHQRCGALGLSRIDAPDHGRSSRPDLNLRRERNLRLHLHAAPVMELLHEQIANTHSMVALTDATGTILLSIGDDDFLSRASRVALAPGADWSEGAKGTNAVGTALFTEQPTLVHADEHFLHANHFLTCSAAPIFDPRGNVLGVLDVSGDHRSYHQHTMALVKMSARMIENHWLGDDCRHGLRLHFHQRVECIGTLMEGILAVEPDGRISGSNRGALEQLGLSGAALRQLSLPALFGLGVEALVDRFRSPLAVPLAVRGPDGRSFHLHARFNGPGWAPLVESVPAQPAVETPTGLVGAMAPGRAAGAPAAPAALEALRPADERLSGIIDALLRVRDTGVPVHLLGGAPGAALALARALHQDSLRAKRPFVRLDASAGMGLAEFEQALAQARTGTLLLHEPGALTLTLQDSLLQHLQGEAPAVVCTGAAALAPTHLRTALFYRLQGLCLQLPGAPEAEAAPAPPSAPDTPSLDTVQRQAMVQALAAAGGNVSAAARALGISRNTLYRKLRWQNRHGAGGEEA